MVEGPPVAVGLPLGADAIVAGELGAQWKPEVKERVKFETNLKHQGRIQDFAQGWMNLYEVGMGAF